MIHELKTWPKYFQAILDGKKRFEYRLNDRGFEVGHMLRLREYDPGTEKYSGREMTVMVTYILQDTFIAQNYNYVIMSINTIRSEPVLSASDVMALTLQSRSDKITLLDEYSIWLTKNGYMDTDWKDEEPFAIDEFLKSKS